LAKQDKKKVKRISGKTLSRIFLAALLSVECLILFGRVIVVENWLITSLFFGSIALAAILLKMAENARPVTVLVAVLALVACFPVYDMLFRNGCNYDEFVAAAATARLKLVSSYCSGENREAQRDESGMRLQILPAQSGTNNLLLITVWPSSVRSLERRTEQALVHPLKTFLLRMLGLTAVKREPYTLTEEFGCN
jgi:hypothetical protein